MWIWHELSGEIQKCRLFPVFLGMCEGGEFADDRLVPKRGKGLLPAMADELGDGEGLLTGSPFSPEKAFRLLKSSADRFAEVFLKRFRFFG